MLDNKALARDFLAVGSWVFYVLVLARSLIEPYWRFAAPLIAAGVVLAAAERATGRFDAYVARGLVLVFFTSAFYQDFAFTVFAGLAFVGVVASADFTGVQRKRIGAGVVAGVVAVLVGVAARSLLV